MRRCKISRTIQPWESHLFAILLPPVLLTGEQQGLFTKKILRGVEKIIKKETLLTKAQELWQSLGIAILIALAVFSGMLTPIDGRIYDFFVRHSPDLKNSPRKVLLVDTPVVAIMDAGVDWNAVADQLLALGARQVVFTVMPEGSRVITENLLRQPRTILGSDLVFDPDDPDTERFNLPTSLAGLLPHAVSEISDPLLGVHRYQSYTYRVGEHMVPSLEALTARRLGIEVPQEGRFLINFHGNSQAFPRLKLQQLLEGKAISAVVRDRVVLVGIGVERFHRAVVTPSTDSRREVSKLDYHAYALDSMLSGTAIASLHPGLKALLVLGAWLGFVVVIQRMSFRKSMLVGTLAIGGLVVLAWLALLGGHVHVPILGPMLVIGTTLVSTVQSKSDQHNLVLEKLANQANLAIESRLRGHLVPSNGRFWTYFLGMVDQMLPVTRLVFLERVKGTAQVRWVESLRCATDAMTDSGNLTQEPYASAIAQGQVMRIQDFFKNGLANERQYLAPIIADGEVLGFFVFGIVNDQLTHQATIERALAFLQRRVADLLLQNQEGVPMELAMASGWRNLHDDARVAWTSRLAQHFQLASRHAELLEDVFDHLDTPTVVYDLFGRQLLANAGMKSLLKMPELAADGSLSAADLLERACGLTPGFARVALAAAVFDDVRFEHAAWIGVVQYKLKSTPLRATDPVASGNADPLANLHGVMLQLLLVQSDPIAGSVTIPTRTVVPDSTSATSPPLIDLWQSIEAATSQIASLRDFEALHFALEGSREPAMVHADPQRMGSLISAILHLFASDSKLPGTVTVTVATDAQHVTLSMRNEGYGMPNERLQAMLHGPTWPQSPTLRRIRQVHADALGPQGKLSLSSAVGRGYAAEVSLARTA